jgi:hypothetical protein
VAKIVEIFFLKWDFFSAADKWVKIGDLWWD